MLSGPPQFHPHFVLFVAESQPSAPCSLPPHFPPQVAESHPERIAAPGDDPNLDLTFKPRLSAYKMEGERTNFFKK